MYVCVYVYIYVYIYTHTPKQVRPIIPAMHQMLRLAAKSTEDGSKARPQTAATRYGFACVCVYVGVVGAGGGEHIHIHTHVCKIAYVYTLQRAQTHAHRAGGHGNVLRTPIGQRPERQEGVSVSVETMLSKLEHIVTNLDAINQRITGVHAHMHACMHAYTYRHQHACVHTQSVAGFLGGVVGVWGGFL